MILPIGLIGVNKLFVYVHILLVYLYFNLYIVIAANNLTTTQTVLQDPATILSKNGDFMLGFFSPANTKNRYLGIWYNHVSVTNYIWVANRNHPIVDNSGVLRISKDGNLQVLSGGVNILWSSNISSLQSDNKTSRDVKLEDSGNLVFQDPDGTIIWQSFDHPTDSILPNMTLKLTSSNMKNALQSWKSPSDPSIGRFSLGTDSLIHPQVVIWDGDKKYWRSGPWNGNLFLGLVYADPSNNYADTSIQNFSPEEAHLIYTGISTLEFSHYVFDYNGRINENYWDKSGKGWKTVYRAPDVECDVYGTCGVFGSCNPEKSPMCRCLKGFSPMNSEEWSNGNWSNGCVRNNPLLCGDEAGKDGFLMLSTVKLPDFAIWLKGLNPYDCRKQCLENCSCLGYTYDNGAGCLYWNNDLIDIQEMKMSGVSLYIRLSHLDLDKANKKKLEKERMRENRSGPVELELKELPYYEFQDLLVATNNFHEKNKLGHGGFGQVYKGKMEDGQEIAVKRLSTAHGQGSEEFVNEVVVISGLQHMNLVRLLGFCTHGEEKILVYEYMPNRSLDAFLFDPTKQEVLNWNKRFNIIEGICRGLVYLHRDSRVRIIHRDLKASNILLDKDLNAKIADFGMARIFGRYQDQEETRRIVGTFGYMAPEYTLEGNFSEKSDVYSFGVLMLEIVTGKKNNAFWCDDQSLTLLGYVWNFWVDGNVGPVLDPVISHPFFRTEIEKCIQIGLLCVQEFVRDRPTMSTVNAMLGSDIADLPIPKKPGFTQRLTASSDSDFAQMLQSSSSTNNMSFTGLSAR